MHPGQREDPANSICGNSAAAAVPPVIGADSDDVVACFAFTAVLDLVAVLDQPLLGLAVGISEVAFRYQCSMAPEKLTSSSACPSEST